MTSRSLLAGLCGIGVLGLMFPAFAKIAKPVRERIEARFPPAHVHEGLFTAQQPLEPTKVRGFVVLARDGLPAEKAYWFITNQDYEYRPVVIDGKTIGTRRGSVYTYLRRGQILLIAGIEYGKDTVYVKCLSPGPMAREGGAERHPSRVALMLGFRLPKAALATDADAALRIMEEWIIPFPDRAGAEAYAAQLVSPQAVPAR